MFHLTQPAKASGTDPRHQLHPLRPSSYADIVERLSGEYEGVVALSAISTIVAGCHRDLAGSPPGALPELTERLARVRIEQTRAPAA